MQPKLGAANCIERKHRYGSMKATPVGEVATRLFVTPRTVFRWRSRFHARQALELPDRLADGPRRGRPKTLSGIIDDLLSAVIEGDPVNGATIRPYGQRLDYVNICAMSTTSRPHAAACALPLCYDSV